ncbi:AsmA family protein [Pseudomonas luteola]|uniref:AsmA family protein n=1 Tax=Pseudomonas luteola TaxID=47886 RepID=A0ABS0MQJ4_PSELU|nr:AsmA family protein [Pseudomonas luteola]
MTRTRKIIVWTLGILVALIVVMIVFVSTFDWNRLKPTINDKASAALNRSFAINGNLGVDWRRETDQGGWRAWVPWPHISAENIEVGNPSWASNPRFLHLDRVQLRISPLALLSKQVYIPRIDVTKPEANLQRLADGRNTWTFDQGDKQEKDPNEASSAWTVDIGTIGFDAGRVAYDDDIVQAHVKTTITSLDAPIAYADIVGQAGTQRQRANVKQTQALQFGWTVKGRYKEQPVEGSGKIGGLLALHDPDAPFPIQADVRAGATHLNVFGTLTEPLKLGALDLRLKLTGQSLGQLYRLTGVTLPETAPYSTDGHLTVVLNDPAGPRFQYEDFSGKVGQSDLHGDLQYTGGKPRPKLTGELTSNQLLFADLAPLIGADSAEQKQARGEENKQPANKALPVSEFRTERWRAMDADVKFTGQRIVQNASLPLSDLYLHLKLTDGVLLIDPLRFGAAGGALNSTVRLEGDKSPMPARMDLHIRGVKLKQLFPTVEAMRDSFGELNGDATLTGTGNSVAALLGSSNGELKVLMNDGSISRSLMEIAGLNVGNYLVSRLFGDDEVAINCAASDLQVTNGLMKTRVFVFDTENALINIDGTVNFANEQIDLSIEPHSKGYRIFSLRSPLYVRGTLTNPSPGVKPLPLAARGAAAALLATFAAPAAGLLALVAPSNNTQDNQCKALLQQMRRGN